MASEFSTALNQRNLFLASYVDHPCAKAASLSSIILPEQCKLLLKYLHSVCSRDPPILSSRYTKYFIRLQKIKHTPLYFSTDATFRLGFVRLIHEIPAIMRKFHGPTGQDKSNREEDNTDINGLSAEQYWKLIADGFDFLEVPSLFAEIFHAQATECNFPEIEFAFATAPSYTGWLANFVRIKSLRGLLASNFRYAMLQALSVSPFFITAVALVEQVDRLLHSNFKMDKRLFAMAADNLKMTLRPNSYFAPLDVSQTHFRNMFMYMNLLNSLNENTPLLHTVTRRPALAGALHSLKKLKEALASSEQFPVRATIIQRMAVLYIAQNILHTSYQKIGNISSLLNGHSEYAPKTRKIIKCEMRHKAFTIELCDLVKLLCLNQSHADAAFFISLRCQRLRVVPFHVYDMECMATTLSRADELVPERLRMRWRVVRYAFTSKEEHALCIADCEFWKYFVAIQTSQYLTIPELSLVRRSVFSDSFDIVRAFYCGDNFTLSAVCVNPLIQYMTTAKNSLLIDPKEMENIPSDYFRMLPYLLYTLFPEGVDDFKKFFRTASMLTPSDEAIHNHVEWHGLRCPSTPRNRNDLPTHPYQGLLSFLCIKEVRYVPINIVEELRSYLREAGVLHCVSPLEGDTVFRATAILGPDGEKYSCMYLWLTYWVHKQSPEGGLELREYIPLEHKCCDYVTWPSGWERKTMSEIWFNFCSDRFIDCELRRRMFFGTSLCKDIQFPSMHGFERYVNFASLDDWIAYSITMCKHLRSPGKQGSIERNDREHGDDNSGVNAGDGQYDDGDLSSPPPYEITYMCPYFSGRRDVVHHSDTMRIFLTFVATLRHGMFQKLPLPFDYASYSHEIKKQSVIDHRLKPRGYAERFDSNLVSNQRTVRYQESLRKPDISELFGKTCLEPRVYDMTGTAFYLGSNMFIVDQIATTLVTEDSPIVGCEQAFWTEMACFSKKQLIMTKQIFDNVQSHERQVSLHGQKGVSFIDDLRTTNNWFIGYSLWKMPNKGTSTPFQQKLWTLLSPMDRVACKLVCNRWKSDLNRLEAACKAPSVRLSEEMLSSAQSRKRPKSHRVK